SRPRAVTVWRPRAPIAAAAPAPAPSSTGSSCEALLESHADPPMHPPVDAPSPCSMRRAGRGVVRGCSPTHHELQRRPCRLGAALASRGALTCAAGDVYTKQVTRPRVFGAVPAARDSANDTGNARPG